LVILTAQPRPSPGFFHPVPVIVRGVTPAAAAAVGGSLSRNFPRGLGHRWEFFGVVSSSSRLQLLARPVGGDADDSVRNATEAYSLDALQGYVSLEAQWAIDSANEFCDVEEDMSTCGEVCGACHGTGQQDCRVCHGTGFFSIGDRLMERGTPCPVCRGKGWEPCKDCRGTGVVAHWMKRVHELSRTGEEDEFDGSGGGQGDSWT